MIVKCKECGKEIADSAEVCPHCGRVHPTMNDKEWEEFQYWQKHPHQKDAHDFVRKFLMWMLAIAIIVAIMFFMMITGIGI